MSGDNEVNGIPVPPRPPLPVPAAQAAPPPVPPVEPSAAEPAPRPVTLRIGMPPSMEPTNGTVLVAAGGAELPCTPEVATPIPARADVRFGEYRVRVASG